MPLRKLPHRELERLIRDHLRIDEDPSTRLLMERLRTARQRGYLTAAELEAVCRWKSPRAIHLIRSNAPRRVRVLTGRALRARDERQRLDSLTELRGVSVPMASALLTLLYPRRYGVLDIRVWQFLHEVGAVSGRPKGVGFGFDHWAQFLAIVREFAAGLRVGARHVELALFRGHQAHQRGRLYD